MGNNTVTRMSLRNIIQRTLFKHLDEMPLPELGNGTASNFAFTEAEMNTICFALAFTEHALLSPLVFPPFKKIRAHYGPTLEKLLERLST